MSRENNGVRPKVTNNVHEKLGDDNSNWIPAKERGMGGAPNQMDVSPREADMASHHGPKGSRGTEKDMGGVGDNKGTSGEEYEFRQSH